MRIERTRPASDLMSILMHGAEPAGDDVLDLTAEMTIESTLNRNTLSLADLHELHDAGYITSASSWAQWLAPDIHWIEPTEYGDEFAKLTKEA